MAHDAEKAQVGIALDYFRPTERMYKWKWRLVAVALAVSLVWGLSGFVIRSQERRLYSHGPVASVHAAWENDCAVCHVSFKPIKNDTLGSFLGISARGSDAKCETCHSGPLHHDNQKPEEIVSCGTCHQDHQGRNVTLTRIADGECVSCHRDIRLHATEGGHLKSEITRFDRDHPEIALIRAQTPDPGKLKFNHKLHLTPGMGDARKTWNGILDPVARERDRLTQPSEEGENKELVRLTCAACHQQDSGDFGIQRESLEHVPLSAVLPAKAAGAKMLPITYENQCKACHPLTVERKVAGNPKSGLVEVPHRFQPPEVREFLEGVYTQELLRNKPANVEGSPTRRTIPGKLTEESTPLKNPLVEKNLLKKLLDDKILAAERALYRGKQTCGECHHYEADGDDVAPKRIAPTKVLDYWFNHAKFDHTAHRAVDCLECHKGAKDSEKSEDVLLPGIATCKSCHRPRSGNKGGARFDCVECHQYHQGVPVLYVGPGPLHGRGARERGPKHPAGIDRFMTGEKPEN